MATSRGGVYLRGKTFWCYYSVGGRQIRESTGSKVKSDALEYLNRQLGDTREALKKFEERKVTLGELADSLERKYQNEGKRSLSTLKIRLKRLLEFFGSTMKAGNVTTEAIDAYAAHRLTRVSRSTVNRELAVLKRLYRAHRLSCTPAFPDTLDEPEARQGFLDVNDLQAILPHLPEDLKDLVTFLFFTGVRKGEAFALTWWNVDRDEGLIRLSGSMTKNKAGRTVPMPRLVREIIERRWKSRHGEYVFHRSGKGITNIYSAWQTATKAAGYEGALLHDFRRSCARALRQAGVAEDVIMAWIGHKTRSMLTRYDIVDEADRKDAARRLSDHLDAQQSGKADLA